MKDALTGIGNRALVDHELIVAREKSQKYVYGGIMVDIDYFKEINDTFGHSVGDEALKNATKILLDSSPRNTLLFRFAGDEFVIFLRLPIDKKNQLVEKMNELKSSIEKNAMHFNNMKNNQYKLNFSMGHATFDTSLPDDVSLGKWTKRCINKRNYIIKNTILIKRMHL